MNRGEGNMKQSFGECRGLLYEIRDLAKGGSCYACNTNLAEHDTPFILTMFSVIERNVGSILGLFDDLERIPGVEDIGMRGNGNKNIRSES